MFAKFRFLFLSIIFLLKSASLILFSQTAGFIEGKVLNSKTSEPVPFATIQLKENQLGIYANAEGDFRILRNPEFQNDSIVITCIGFKRYSSAYNEFSNNAENTITLVPVTGNPEADLIASGKIIGSLEIINMAIKNIPRNNPVKPFNYIAYFMDYQKKDGKYINLNEALIQTLDIGFLSNSLFNSYRLLDFRKNSDFPRMNISPIYESEGAENHDSLFKSIHEATVGDPHGNELPPIMTHDVLRNFNSRSFSFIDVFSVDFVLNHNFSEPVAAYNNKLLLYKIIFNGKTRVTGNSLLVTGAIYIEPKSYAIHKIEYSCSHLENGKRPLKLFNTNIEYGRDNDVDSSMCLKYISFNNYFKAIDVDDDTYFRLLQANWETTLFINPTLVLNFNNKIDPVSASDTTNYKVFLGSKPVKITSVQVRDKSLFIRTKDEYLPKNADSTYFNIYNLKDSDGNILHSRKRIGLYQFRELFVQKYNKPLSLKDSCFMEYRPIEQNCRSSYSGNEKFWMNTPVNIKIADK